MGANRVNEIFNDIKSDILKGNYKAGTRIPSERNLCKQYDASRVSIREAIGKLSQLGLVRKVPQSGTYVCDLRAEDSLNLLVQTIRSTSSLDPEMLISLLEILRVGALFAVEKATRKMTPAHIRELKQVLDTKKTNLHDAVILSECDFRIHKLFADLSENLFVEVIFNSFKQLYISYTIVYYSLQGTAERTLAYHQRLLNALEKRDVTYAVYVLEQSLIYAECKFKDNMEDRG